MMAFSIVLFPLCALLFVQTTNAANKFAICVVTDKAILNFKGEVKLQDVSSGKHTVSTDCTASEFTVTKKGNAFDIDHNDYLYEVSPTGLKVDGKTVVIPEGSHVTEGTVEVYHEPNNVYRLKFHRGGSVVYRDGKIILNVNPHFKGRLCGICGNFGADVTSFRSIAKFD